MQVSDGIRPLTTPTQLTGQRVRRWPLLLIAAPAAVSIWSGWVGLGQICGFGIVHPLPGIWDSLRLNTAITLPVGVEAYGAYALGAWLTPGTSEAARGFAKRSAIGSLVLGVLGQIAYHLMAAAHTTRAPWPATVLVACMPVVTLGFGAALTHLLRGSEATAPAVASVDVETVVDLPDPVSVSRPAISLAWPHQVRIPKPESKRTRTARASRTRTAPVTDAAAALRYASDIAAGSIPSMRRIRADLRVGQVRAQAIKKHLQSLSQDAVAA